LTTNVRTHEPGRDCVTTSMRVRVDQISRTRKVLFQQRCITRTRTHDAYPGGRTVTLLRQTKLSNPLHAGAVRGDWIDRPIGYRLLPFTRRAKARNANRSNSLQRRVVIMIGW
jgi:hypothetical protein